ncbi:MAG: formyltetrahydrofolate deformylase [Deltaproteobacteria bacterium]|nr:formyltetrahydrofolate deformylase [Deltaproteobacteria bacterium]
MKQPTVILLLSCPDQKGIVASISNFIFKYNGNILSLDQYAVQPDNILFMRVEWDLDGFSISREDIEEVFRPLAERFTMKWSLHFSDHVHRMAIFASQHLHCFHDLLMRRQMGELNGDIVLAISNHLDLKPTAEQFNIPFKYYPITADTKELQEEKELLDLEERRVDLIVLARYMQILSPSLVHKYPHRIINIHHSFLPAFAGGSPYRQAYERGVKVIGATSHYVTDQLDEGPIIAQDVIKVSHKDSVEHMKMKGADIERVVLARAVRLHLERRILICRSKTIIFD